MISIAVDLGHLEEVFIRFLNCKVLLPTSFFHTVFVWRNSFLCVAHAEGVWVLC